jgi:integrase/recombinase XerD
MDIIYLMQREMMRRQYSHRTIVTYMQCLRQFLRKCHKEPRRIARKDIQQYIDHLVDKGVCGNTINVHLNALLFVMRDVLNKRVMLRIRYAKTPKRQPTDLSVQDVKRLLSVIDNEKHLLMISLMYGSGLRVSELCNVRVRDVDIENAVGTVQQGKGGKRRVFVVPRVLIDQIASWVDENGLKSDSFLFPGRSGAISVRSVQEIVKRAGKKAGIAKPVHPHMLRHSYATHTVRNGHDLVSLQSLLGHRSVDTTMQYVHMAGPRMIAVESPLDVMVSEE